jgi:hypothetical protein
MNSVQSFDAHPCAQPLQLGQIGQDAAVAVKPRQLAHTENRMAWKMDGEHIATADGKPVWIGADNSEVPVDHGHSISKINELTRESVGRKEKIREFEEKYVKHLDGIDDPAAFVAKARKAMEIAENLDAKKLIDVGEVEKVKAQISEANDARFASFQKATNEKLSALEKMLAEKEDLLNREMIGGRFKGSKFISDSLIIPADIAEAMFGRNFKIKDGKVVAVGHDGGELYSRVKTGDPADFEEAMSILVDGYPNKAAILKGSNASGGGSQSGGRSGDGSNTSKLMAMSPEERLTAARAQGLK